MVERSRCSPARSRLVVLALTLALGLVGPGRPVRAEEGPLPDAEREAEIQALQDERDRISLTGPIIGVAAGAVILQGGLSTIISTQYNCPGYWDCSDETRWGLTAGSGAAIVVGAITLAIMGPRLSERLKARRELHLEIHRLRTASGARKPQPTFDWGLALDDRRQGVHATIRV